jgi:hypothetical protein
MRKSAQVETWVVYKVIKAGDSDGRAAVCEQAEWAELAQGDPGRYTLVRAGIASEPEAERLARDLSGFVAVRVPQLKARV